DGAGGGRAHDGEPARHSSDDPGHGRLRCRRRVHQDHVRASPGGADFAGAWGRGDGDLWWSRVAARQSGVVAGAVAPRRDGPEPERDDRHLRLRAGHRVVAADDRDRNLPGDAPGRDDGRRAVPGRGSGLAALDRHRRGLPGGAAGRASGVRGLRAGLPLFRAGGGGPGRARPLYPAHTQEHRLHAARDLGLRCGEPCGPGAAPRYRRGCVAHGARGVFLRGGAAVGIAGLLDADRGHARGRHRSHYAVPLFAPSLCAGLRHLRLRRAAGQVDAAGGDPDRRLGPLQPAEGEGAGACRGPFLGRGRAL
ncbi:MAG: Membrane protein, partial [uncultured Rubellimicrobium sp.]